MNPVSGLVGIDGLMERFVPNSEVSDVKMFSIKDLLVCAEPQVQMARLLTPTWTSTLDGGRPRVYPNADQVHIESAFQADDGCGVSVLGGRAMVHPVAKTHISMRHARQQLRTVERLDSVRIRDALLGPAGSLASCAPMLLKLIDETRPGLSANV